MITIAQAVEKICPILSGGGSSPFEKCRASRCMMWRWKGFVDENGGLFQGEVGDDRRVPIGVCGLAGDASYYKALRTS